MAGFDYSKVIGTNSRTEVATGQDVNDLTAMGRATEDMNAMVTDRQALEGYVGKLLRGQRYAVNVDTDIRPSERRGGIEGEGGGGTFRGCWIANKSGADVTPKKADKLVLPARPSDSHVLASTQHTAGLRHRVT